VEEVFVDKKLRKLPPPFYSCLYISAGKKTKSAKATLLDCFTKKGGLQSGDIGLITTLDFSSYVSVKRDW